MEDFWARHIEPSGQPGPNYWTYFAQRLVDLACIPEGSAVLDIGTYEAILRQSGFHDIRIHVETTAFVSPDTTTWWRQMKQATGDYFEEMPELEWFRKQVLADLKPFQSAKGIHFDKTVAYAFGTKL